MARAVEHRGPDESGQYLAKGIGLGIRRLRIIDLVGGRQPMANEDDTIWTVHNGEIYNFLLLRDELRAKGHIFRTNSDTEVIVHGYEEWGKDCVRRFRGMFAFAVWDERRQILVLARDRLGKKPLVYAEVGGSLYFASEIQALVRVAEVPREIDWGALGDYLAYGYVPGPATIFRAVRKLLPGHVAVWDGSRLRCEQYWRLEYVPKLRLTEDEALDELERRLADAVRVRLIADVPLGALLSGGVDSSTVVALMARESSERVRTFSVGFDDKSYDELVHSRRVAQRYETDHHEFVVQPDAAAVLPTLVRHYGEPYADSSALPTYYVTKLAREDVTVALNGDGGDEDFGGYARYQAMAWSERARQTLGGATLLQAMATVADHLPEQLRVVSRAKRFLSAARLPAANRYARWMSSPSVDLAAEVLADELLTRVQAERSYAVERAYETRDGLDPVERAIATDVATYLPYDLLVKMDIASMANSLETRSPFLDHELVEFAARLPSALKIGRGQGQKYLLRRLARKYVPSENIDRPKMGFGVPVGAWLRGQLKEFASDALLGARFAGRGLFRPAVVRKLWDEHQASVRDHAHALWTLLMLELWQREFVDRSA